MVRNCGELGINLQKIVMRLLSNNNLIKLLYYTDKDPLSQRDLSEDEKKKFIFDKLIRVIPTTTDKDGESQSIISIYIANGSLLSDNLEFREITVKVDVLVPLTQWKIKDSNLRPFAILGEIQKSLSGVTVNGLGSIRCGDFNLAYLTQEISVYQQELYITEYD